MRKSRLGPCFPDSTMWTSRPVPVHGSRLPARGGLLRRVVLLSLPALFGLWLALELFFRFAIPAAQKPLPVFDEREAMLRSDERGPRRGVYTAGRLAQLRAEWRTNNYGWNSAIDYEPAAGERRDLVAVIGDSFVRGLQVDVGERFPALLRERLAPGTGSEVYSFAHDGAPLSQYLHMARYAVRHFAPSTLVFVLVHNDFDQSLRDVVALPYFLQLEEGADGLVEVAPHPVPVYGLLRRSALVRYLYSNARLGSLFLRPAGEHFAANVDADAIARRVARIETLTRYWMTTLSRENPDRRIVIAMDAPREALYAGTLEESPVRWLNAMVGRLCGELGLEWLDLTIPFRHAFDATGERFESEVDRHWNEHGHRVVARALSELLLADSRSSAR